MVSRLTYMQIKLTDCFCSISAIVCSYWSPKRAILRRCSSFSFRMVLFCSSFGVFWSTCVFNALYCLVWILHVSLNCFLISTSFCFKLFGCCFVSSACFFFNSLCALRIYSSWLFNSVECCLQMWSSLTLCTDLCCFISNSWVCSWCRISISWAYSSWDWRLFSS